jgi:4'-phosphopantetheinyl transferase
VRRELPILRESELPGVREAWAALDDPRRVPAELAGCLSVSEREPAGRFRFEPDRRRFVVAHAILRGLLAESLDSDPKGVEIVTDAFGKPRLGAAASGLAFNLSHTGERALYALAPGVELGVDAEELKPLADMSRLAQDVFSARELAEWKALPEAERVAGFFGGWTRKEAVLKALGRGLDYPLRAFSASLAPGGAARLLHAPVETGPASEWSLTSLCPEPGYLAAVVARREAAR